MHAVLFSHSVSSNENTVFKNKVTQCGKHRRIVLETKKKSNGNYGVGFGNVSSSTNDRGNETNTSWLCRNEWVWTQRTKRIFFGTVRHSAFGVSFLFHMCVGI